jgi:hypothetical protein
MARLIIEIMVAAAPIRKILWTGSVLTANCTPVAVINMTQAVPPATTGLVAAGAKFIKLEGGGHELHPAPIITAIADHIGGRIRPISQRG